MTLAFPWLPLSYAGSRRSFLGRASRPIVLFALQAPTLLPLLAASTLWDLRVLPMGDHEGLAEAAGVDGLRALGSDTPDVIVVCSPAHRKAAEQLCVTLGKDIPIVWAAHNGYQTELLDGWQGPLLTFSANNLHAHSPESREQTFVIRPHVPRGEELAIGTLFYGGAFTMQNRPSTRQFQTRMRGALFDEAVAASGLRVDRYGQDQPLGPLSPSGKRKKFATALGYASCLPTNAGFGLAEHEALAHGCPVFGLLWGDAHVTLADYPGLVSSQAQLTDLFREVATYAGLENAARAPELRKNIAQAGYDLLATHYTLDIMDAGIAAFLSGLL